MLNSRTEDIKKLVTRQADYDCFELPEGEEYRIEFIQELIEVKNNIYEVDGFNNEELDDILCFLCTSWWLSYILYLNQTTIEFDNKSLID